MKKQIILSMILAASLFSFEECLAQLDTSKVRDALKKVNLAYLKMYPLKSQVTYSYYSDYNSNPEQSVSYTIYSDTGFQCMVSKEIESYEYDSLRVFINHTEKAVSVEKKIREPFNFTSMFRLDSLWHIIEHVGIQDQGNERIYTMTLSQAVYSKIVFRVNKSMGIMTRIQLFSNPDLEPELARAMLEVTISGVQKNNKYLPGNAVSQKIKIDASGKVLLIGPIKGYRLLTPSIG